MTPRVACKRFRCTSCVAFVLIFTEYSFSADAAKNVAKTAAAACDWPTYDHDLTGTRWNSLLHSRTDCVDHPEPERKRRLLRLWLMMPDWLERPDAMNFTPRLIRLAACLSCTAVNDGSYRFTMAKMRRMQKHETGLSA